MDQIGPADGLCGYHGAVRTCGSDTVPGRVEGISLVICAFHRLVRPFFSYNYLTYLGVSFSMSPSLRTCLCLLMLMLN